MPAIHATAAKLRHEMLDAAFERDCMITLTQCKESNPQSYFGPGTIKLREDGTLSFRMFSPDKEEYDPVEDFQSVIGVQLGKMYDADDFFELSAVAWDGVVWVSESIIIQKSRPASRHRLWKIEGKLDSIANRTRAWKVIEHSVTLIIAATELRKWEWLIGAEIDCHDSDDASLRITASAVGSDIAVKACRSTPLPENMESRLLEALSFVIARPMATAMRINTDPNEQKTAILSKSFEPENVRLSPPINTLHSSQDARLLFGRYLSFILKDRSTRWHHCSAHLYHALESSTGSLGAWATGTCVAVEGLAGELSIPSSDSPSELIQCLRETSKKWLAKKKADSGFMNRVSGLLGQLSNPRVQDRLEKCVAQGEINTTHIDAWKKLRNKNVHSGKLSEKDFKSEAIQKVLDQLYTVTTLMYQIVFVIIAYDGQYTDYSTRNFPLRKIKTDAPPKSE